MRWVRAFMKRVGQEPVEMSRELEGFILNRLQAARVFDPGVDREGGAQREREIERLHAKIGRLTVKRHFLVERSGR